MRVAVIGASGFVGGYLLDALLAGNYQPAVLVRPASQSKLRCATRCHVVTGTMTAAALRETLSGCDAVIYNAGILRERRHEGVSFDKVQYRGVVDTLEAAQRNDVRRIILMSANGVKQGGVAYQHSRFRAEQAVISSGIAYTIFRPSVIFGDPRGNMEIATQLYLQMIKPRLPAVAFQNGWAPSQGQIMMSPVHVSDIAAAFVAALDNEDTIDRTYVLGGSRTLSWTDMLRCVASAVGRRKLLLPMPIGMMRIAATLFDWLPFFPVTRDQLSMLSEGNCADAEPLQSLIRRKPLAFESQHLAYLRD